MRPSLGVEVESGAHLLEDVNRNLHPTSPQLEDLSVWRLIKPALLEVRTNPSYRVISLSLLSLSCNIMLSLGLVVLCEAPLQEEKWELWWQCKPWCKFICLSSHSSLYLELILSIRSTSLLLDKHKWNGKGIDIKRWTSNWKWSFGEKENFRISKVQGNKDRDRVPTHYLHVYSSDRVRILFKFTHSHSDRGKSKHYQRIDI